MSGFSPVNLVNGGGSPRVRVRGLRAPDPLPFITLFFRARGRSRPAGSSQFGERGRELEGVSAWTARPESAPVHHRFSRGRRRP